MNNAGKIVTLIVSIFCVQYVFAENNIDLFLSQHQEELEKHVSKKQLVIQFEKNVKSEAKQLFFKQYSYLIPYSEGLEIGRNNVVVAKLKNELNNYTEVKEVLQQLKQHEAVKLVNPILENEDANPVLVLNPIFFSLKQNASLNTIQAFLIERGIETIKPHTYLKNIFQFENNKHCAYNNIELAAFLMQSEWVAFSEPNYGLFINACTVTDQYFPRQWHIENTGTAVQGNGTPGADMEVVNAWSISTGSPNIKVAVLDSGVDTLHADLIDNILPGFDATSGGSNGYPNLRFREDAHGTACSGIIGAMANNSGLGVAGVAYDSKIIPIKIFYYVDSIFTGQVTPYAESQWMADGIAWAWQFGDADVMSNSWAVQDLLLQILPGSPTLVDTAIAQVYQYGRNGKGIPLFFSSGNEGGLPYWPGRKPETIAINATSMCDERKSPTSCDGESWEGNWKGALDFSAPGVRIPTTDISGVKGYNNGDFTLTFNGTSAACPNAAAVAALLYSVNENLEVEDIRFIMGNTADKVGGYEYSFQKYAGNWSEELGYGRLNAFKALTMARNYNVGVREYKDNALVSIFPNPVEDNTIYVSLKNNDEKIYSVEIINTEGKIIVANNFSAALNNEVIVSLPQNLPSGFYFVKIKTENNFYTKKLVRK
jgi:subtilisin family serine protease